MVDEEQLSIEAAEGALPETPHGTVVVPMTREEARELVHAIRGDIESARAKLLRLYEGEGWKPLGYKNWRECAVGEFGQSARHLYEELRAAGVERDICAFAQIGSIPETHLRPLAPIKEPEERRAAWSEAVETAGEKRITQELVEQVVQRRQLERNGPAFLEKKGLTPEAATEVYQTLQRMPEDQRRTVAAIITQKGIPVDRAVTAVRSLGEMSPEDRHIVLSRYENTDLRERGVAIAQMVKGPVRADPRRVVLSTWLEEIEHCVRMFPGDPLNERFKELIELTRRLVDDVMRQEQERVNGTDGH